MSQLNLPGTTIVRTKEQAQKVIHILRQFPDRVHAWDTETIDINAKEETPVGNGKVICASCFIGPDVDFGEGPRLFIDNYADAKDVMLEFKDYFEDPEYLKCWHNYGYDRHILYNHGIDCKGFGGDTMQMARLHDPSRMPNEYALSKLSKVLDRQVEETKMDMIETIRQEISSGQ